ncbi:MAG: DUF3996 domain-containing protein [Planctomycetes bacterium]|nr:DUF3996 domain-containing protein [Planctomycetota bacterium]
MKHQTTLTVVLVFMGTSAFAQDQLGLGLILGEPTGLSVKYWLDDEHAIDGAAGWSFWDDDGFQLHADYLWHNYELLDLGETEGRVPVYYGLGARLKFENDDNRGRGDDDDTVFGIRAPLGITYRFANEPLDLFAEIVPVLDLTPDVELNLNLAVGIRIYVH